MAKLRAITSEQKRILQAAADGRLGYSVGRYFIDGEDPPARRDREHLQKRGLLTRPSSDRRVLTDKGIEAFLEAPVSDLLPSKPEQLSFGQTQPKSSNQVEGER